MEWWDIVSSILTLLLGGGLGGFVGLKFSKRKANAEVQATEGDTISKYLDIIDRTQSENTALQDRCKELHNQLDSMRSECHTKGEYMCVHIACPLRRPAFGQGTNYYKSHKDSEDFGADYSSLDDLLAAYKRRRVIFDDDGFRSVVPPIHRDHRPFEDLGEDELLYNEGADSEQHSEEI